MKTLYVLRHAKSKWGPEYATDLERPLAKRGKRDAVTMGALLLERGLAPDLIISSPAQRARQTARRLAKAMEQRRGDIVYHDGLYFEGARGVLAAVQDAAGEEDRVMVVGHNPTLEELVAHLARSYARLPTATVAIIDLDITSWSELGESTGRLRAVLSPKEN